MREIYSEFNFGAIPLTIMRKGIHFALLSGSNDLPKHPDRDSPFSLWRANSEIKICSIIENEKQVETCSMFNCFDGVNKLTYDGYIYHFNRQKEILNGETSLTYYFRCSNRQCHCTLTVVVHLKGYNYTITPNDKIHESSKCKRTSTMEQPQSVARAMIECKSFAIELSRNNPKMKPKDLIDLILREFVLYNLDHADSPMPCVSNNKIREWLKIPRPISAKELSLNYIPDEIRFRGRQWVLAELVKKKQNYIIILNQDD